LDLEVKRKDGTERFEREKRLLFCVIGFTFFFFLVKGIERRRSPRFLGNGKGSI